MTALFLARRLASSRLSCCEAKKTRRERRGKKKTKRKEGGVRCA